MLKEKLDTTVITKLRLMDKHEPRLENWHSFLQKLKNPKKTIRVGLVGKYNELPDAYKSIYESFIHAGAANECKVEVVPIHSERLTPENAAKTIEGLHGVLVAPGFGERGIEGKLAAIRYVREHNIPFFGICLGMQCAVVEFARNVLGWHDATSTEWRSASEYPVIDMMDEQKTITNKGGTMRLGAYTCQLSATSKTAKAYATTEISERHRHRFEFNNAYTDDFKNAGMHFVGINLDTNLVEVIELPTHKFFVGVQYHPELKSTVECPHPLFVSFVAAISNYTKPHKVLPI